MSDIEKLTSGAAISSSDLEDIKNNMRDIVDIQDRKYGFPSKLYKKCFVGSEAVVRLIDSNMATDIDDALLIGNMLLKEGIIHHVHRDHDFKDEYLFYRFAEDDDHGKPDIKSDGTKVSWAEFIPLLSRERKYSLQAHIPDKDPDFGKLKQVELETCGVTPLDEHNVRLLDNIHPKKWIDPEPEEIYNLVAVGGGAGGLITSGGTAALGGSSAVIESHLLGGDCLNVGCVPSKALLSCAKMAASIGKASEYGVEIEGEVTVNFPKVMERMRKLRADISPVDSASRYAGEKGVDVFIGKGRFTGKDSIEVNGKTLRFKKAVIATGGSAAVPNIPGLDKVPYLTNATIFNLTKLPGRMGIIGSGPIGLEMAQAFQRFGSKVTVFSRSGEIIPKEDRDAAEIVEKTLISEGVNFIYNVDYKKIEKPDGSTGIFIEFMQSGKISTLEVDELLIAIGRKPNVSGLGLEEAGVEYDERTGIHVNDMLQTSNPDIFAVGDVATKYQFTHVSDFMARIALRNALVFGRDKFSDLLIPWATYTDPEVAHVGLYERDLIERNISYKTFAKEFSDVDRAIVEGCTKGFVKIHVRKGSGEILGATIVGNHAGDMISEITVAMQSGMGLGKLAGVIHPYPTLAEAVRQCGDNYNAARLTPTVKKILYGLMEFRR